MDESHRKLLKDHRVALVEDLDPTEVYDHLIQADVLSAEDEEIIEAQSTRKGKTRKLMSILPRKGPDAFEVFTEALKKAYPYLHSLLLEGAGSTYTSSADAFADIQRELKGHYTSCLKDIYPAPWLPEFPLDLTEVYVRLRLQEQEEEVNQDQIFVPHANKKNPDAESRQKEENPTRILVEGDPGIGKSTLCQKLANSWCNDSCGEQCCSPCIHSFELVVYLTAADLRGYKDIPSAIHAHLLPKDSQISVSAVGKALRNRNVLFIVDSYDEACTENPLLHDLIQRKVAVQSTVLLTSRPNYLRKMLKCFDRKLYVDGFDDQQRREYVEKFAQHKNRPFDEFQYLLEDEKRSEFTDLCYTPLNMSIVCLMSTIQNTSFSTRTKLYQSVHEFILEKASDRLNLSREDIERTIIDPLCKLSFEAYMKGEAVLMEEDFKKSCSDSEQFCRAGYLIKKIKISLFRGEIRFSFSHRTFQEFLSALYLKQLSVAERQKWLNAVDLKQNESIVSFLFGMLEDNEEALLPIASNIMDRTFFSFVNPFIGDYGIPNDCPESHLLLRCLLELKTMPPKLEHVITRNCPSKITLHSRCSSKCIKGVSTIFSLGNLEQNSISLVMHIHTLNTMLNEIITMLDLLTKCKSVDQVMLVQPDGPDLSRLLYVMGVGQIDSFIQRFKIDGPEMLSLNSEDTRGMELRNNGNINIYLSFLRAAQNKPLTTFGIISDKLELDDECVEMMSTVLKNHLLQNVSVDLKNYHLSPKAYRTRLISLLADLKDLRSAEINVTEMNKEDWGNFGRLLQNQTLQKLTLIRCHFSKDCCDVLSQNFQTMPFLKNLRFKYGRINDIEGFGKVLLAARDLQTLSIDLNFEEVHVDILREVLPKLVTLKALELSVVLFDLNKPSGSYLEAYKTAQEQQTEPPNRRTFALQRLLRAIGQCKGLESLSFGGIRMSIGDAVVQDLCRAVTSLKQLKHLRLPSNKLTKIGITQLSECLKLKPGERVFLEES